MLLAMIHIFSNRPSHWSGMIRIFFTRRIDFSTTGQTRALGTNVVGVIATNKDLHPAVIRASGKAAAEAAMA